MNILHFEHQSSNIADWWSQTCQAPVVNIEVTWVIIRFFCVENSYRTWKGLKRMLKYMCIMYIQLLCISSWQHRNEIQTSPGLWHQSSLSSRYLHPTSARRKDTHLGAFSNPWWESSMWGYGSMDQQGAFQTHWIGGKIHRTRRYFMGKTMENPW